MSEDCQKDHMWWWVSSLLWNLHDVPRSVRVMVATKHVHNSGLTPSNLLGNFCLGPQGETVQLNVWFTAQNTQSINAHLLVSLGRSSWVSRRILATWLQPRGICQRIWEPRRPPCRSCNCMVSSALATWKAEATVPDSLKPGLLQLNLEHLFPSIYVQNHFWPCEIFSQ